jgi:hypothetical protein
MDDQWQKSNKSNKAAQQYLAQVVTWLEEYKSSFEAMVKRGETPSFLGKKEEWEPVITSLIDIAHIHSGLSSMCDGHITTIKNLENNQAPQ